MSDAIPKDDFVVRRELSKGYARIMIRSWLDTEDGQYYGVLNDAGGFDLAYDVPLDVARAFAQKVAKAIEDAEARLRVDSENLISKTFGCLTVKARLDDYVWAGGASREPLWRVECRCGAEGARRSSHLKRRPDRCRSCPKPTPKACIECGENRSIYSEEGLCQSCYRRRNRELPPY